ncbi:MAG: D-aminoacyl-tRNA deacylase [Paludibacteraceae bacterium]|nr:D-aminoacyl-tRNA deacylase [Paludibacteraceae bacterium]
MRTLIQRVQHAEVVVDGQEVSRIAQGLMVLVGIEDADTVEDIDYLAGKLVKLRVFDDEAGVMNRSVMDIGGEVMLVSQFTLMAATAKGNRPSYIRAAKPDFSKPMYETFCTKVEALLGKPVARGIFGADMKVTLLNDGPVTIWMDSKNKE